MYTRLLIVFLLLSNFQWNDEVVIEWSNAKKLTWSDFKGPIDRNSDAVAVTASGITFSFSVKESNGRYKSFNAEAKAHFYPEKSWYDKAQTNDHILAHEQLHFDITELHVRRLRYQIAKLNVSQSIKEQLRQLHRNANVQLAEMQNSYDVQTDNSRNVEAQVKWSLFVHAELQKFQDYRSQ